MQTTPRALLNYIGIAILIAGMGAGEFIYWRSLHAPAASADADAGPSPYDSREYQYAMEVNVGVFGLIMDQWSRAAANLTRPGPLAILIAGASMLAAGGCFLAASRLPRE